MRREKVSYRKAVSAALDFLLGSDPRVVFLGEDISEYGGAFGVSGALHRKYPERVISTPISEGSFTGVAIGLAMTGFRPIVEIMFMDFLTLAMDQLINHASSAHYMYGAQLSCPMVLRTPAGGYRGYGPSHSKALESTLLGTPGLKIVAPSTPQDAFSLLIASAYDNNPVVFVEHKLLYNAEEEASLSADSPAAEIGKARVAREGRDATVVSHSYGVHMALKAAESLSREGIEAEVIDLRTLKPLDMETIAASVKKTGRLVCVEEGSVFGGVGAEVAAGTAESCIEYLDGKIVRVGKPDVPIPASMAAERFVLPSPEDIETAVKKTLSWR